MLIMANKKIIISKQLLFLLISELTRLKKNEKIKNMIISFFSV
jgi:hypothetical protein